MTRFAVFERSYRDLTENFLARFQDSWELDEHYPLTAIYREMGQRGLLRATLPEVCGGDGQAYSWDLRGLEILATLGCGAIGMSIATHQHIILPLLARFGNPALTRDWLRRAASGEAIFGIDQNEVQAQSDLDIGQASYRREQGDFVITGTKRYVTNGRDAHALCILAQDAEHSAHTNPRNTLFLVPTNLPGISRTHLNTIGNRGITAEVNLNSVRISAAHVLGGEGQGSLILCQQLPQEHLLTAVRAAAISRWQLSVILQQCQNRKTFGQPLASNQALRFRYAELTAELGSLEALNWRCESLLIDQENVAELTAIAKLHGGRLVRETSNFLLQVSGGNGYLEGHAAERAYRDGLVISPLGSSDETMLAIIAGIDDPAKFDDQANFAKQANINTAYALQ
jgi:citronellyl-CoA dehydrogenase